MRRALFALAFALPSPVLADGIAISMDEVRTVTFGGPIATVYVGNPAIADVNMIDARHAFVIGKGFGIDDKAMPARMVPQLLYPLLQE